MPSSTAPPGEVIFMHCKMKRIQELEFRIQERWGF
jgi:hypothetical protein